MAHVAKHTRGAIGHLMKHYERAKGEDGEYIRFGNQHIDLNRTEQNYNLAPSDGRSQLERFHDRMSEVYCLNRNDVNVLCSWVVTVPEDLPKEHEREFFERTYKFLEKKYGEQNVVSAYVHKDETTPHLHFAFIPVVYDKKKNREKVSAKEVLTKVELKNFHQDLQKEMNRFAEEHDYSFECNVLNGATENGNLTIQELYARQIEELTEREEVFLDKLVDETNIMCLQLQDMEQTSCELQNEHEKLKEYINALDGVKNALKDELEALEGRLKSMDNDEILMMKKFVENPKVKPIFEQYVQALHKQGSRVSVKEKMANYEKMIAERKQQGASGLFGRTQNRTSNRGFERDER